MIVLHRRTRSRSGRVGWAMLSMIAILVLTGCGGAASQPTLSDPVSYTIEQAVERTDLLDYHDTDYPFALRLPREWYLGQLEDHHYGLVAASTNDPSQPRAAISILVEPSDVGADVMQAVGVAEETLQSQAGIAGFKVDLARQATVNTLQGHERLYSYILDQHKIRQRTVYAGDGEQLYAISLIAPVAIYAQHESLFNDVLASFRTDQTS